MQHYIKCIKNYGKFSERASRKEFWIFTLISTVFLIIFMLIDNFIFKNTVGVDGFGILSYCYLIITFIPTLAVMVRRLHDIGKSGLMALIIIIPIIGLIWIIVLLAKKGSYDENKYGIVPK